MEEEELTEEKMKTYYFSIDFDQAGFTAKNEDEANKMALKSINEDKAYSIQLVDVDKE